MTPDTCNPLAALSAEWHKSSDPAEQSCADELDAARAEWLAPLRAALAMIDNTCLNRPGCEHVLQLIEAVRALVAGRAGET